MINKKRQILVQLKEGKALFMKVSESCNFIAIPEIIFEPMKLKNLDEPLFSLNRETRLPPNVKIIQHIYGCVRKVEDMNKIEKGAYKHSDLFKFKKTVEV